MNKRLTLDSDPSGFKNLIDKLRFRKLKPEHFFKYVESYTTSKKMLNPGLMEYFIQEYFEKFFFENTEFVYSKKISSVIVSFFKKNKNRVSPLLLQSEEVDGRTYGMFKTVLPDKALKQYLTLIYPQFNPKEDLETSIAGYNSWLSQTLGIRFK